MLQGNLKAIEFSFEYETHCKNPKPHFRELRRRQVKDEKMRIKMSPKKKEKKKKIKAYLQKHFLL